MWYFFLWWVGLTIGFFLGICIKHTHFQAENKRYKEALGALKGLVHYHFTVCNIDDQSEDEIVEFIEQTLEGE